MDRAIVVSREIGKEEAWEMHESLDDLEHTRERRKTAERWKKEEEKLTGL